MHPFSIEFNTSDIIFSQIISLIVALFIVITWFRNHKHVRISIRILVGILGGVVSYYLAVAAIAILQSFYTTIKDNSDPHKQDATIISYKKYVRRRSNNRGGIRRPITYYKPLLNYKIENGAIKEQYADISFSQNNKMPIGTRVKVIIEDQQVRMHAAFLL